MISGSIQKLLLIDSVNIYFSQSIVYANIYLFSIFFSIDFKSGVTPHYLYRDSLTLNEGFYLGKAVNSIAVS